MKALGYYNGEYGPLDEMRIPMTDRAVYYGDGIYEAAPARNGIIYALDAHIARMFRSMALLRIPAPMPDGDIQKELTGMLAHLDDSELLVYWQVSRGTGRRAHPFPDGKPNFMMMITPFTPPDLSVPVKCITEEDTRFLHCNIKTINLIPSIMAMQKAKEAGCYEAILHRAGRVTECSKSNVHMLKNGTLVTAPADNLILSGIARMHLFEACDTLGIPVVERPYTVSELMDADEIFTSSSSSFLRRVVEVDGKPAGSRDESTALALRTYIINRYFAETNA